MKRVAKAVARRLLWIEPCGCGCELVRMGGGDPRQAAEWRHISLLSPVAQWACR